MMLEPRMTAQEALDAYFLETRAKLLEIAATLDRIERLPGGAEASGDARLRFVAEALELLKSGGPGRAERIQRLYSMA
ncbi:MAG TPA: hypothetical protein VM008_18345 [Phycisphaerae bacterium]|nr:hypothetical protein [Phycisphaerae bacterium]